MRPLNRSYLLALLLISSTVLPLVSLASATGTLAASFQHPPADTRPWVYWYFMDGNLSREGMTADLEAMQRAGIGGAIFLEVNLGLPRGPVEFMSPEWRRLVIHGIREADRLGLQIALGAGPGWCGTGGPWVKPEQSMQHIVGAETNITGPMQFDALLPRPSPRSPFFGMNTLTPELKHEWESFYRDVAVLAFPTPSSNAGIAELAERALYFRAPYSSQKGVKPFLPAPAQFDRSPPERCVAGDSVIELTRKLSSDGRLVWNVPAGRWTIARFGRTLTGQTTRPAPKPGLGFESDKFDRAALDAHFQSFVGQLLAELGPGKRPGRGLTTLHFDSWEMSSQNWSAKFREQFSRRRGYDPMRFLPVLTGRMVENEAASERFLWDLRQTAQELVVDNHAQRLKELAHRNGLAFSLEPYDMNPCADLTLGSAADVPQCEFWYRGFNTAYSVIEAASIAHTCGRPIVAAEAFTSEPGEDWKADPAALKTLGDWAFCTGVNRLIFHRYQHQPRLDRWPGMTMGPYGVHWERTQTWWGMAPAYHEYLARCQFLLRQGLPVADVCFLAAEGAPHVFVPPASSSTGTPPDHLGYSFDGCAPETLLDRAKVKNGQIVFPDGMSYHILALPEMATMTPKLLRKIQDLVRGGATVVGPRPLKSPSLAGYPRCDTEVEKLAGELWGNCDGTTIQEHAFGKGRIVWRHSTIAATEQYGEFSAITGVLKEMGVAPDFESDGPIRFMHRHKHDTDIYFVANREPKMVEATCTFRGEGTQPELWDPVDGQTRDLPEFSETAGRIKVPLRFEPAQSFFIVFRNAKLSVKPVGRNFYEVKSQFDLIGPWQVAFDPRWGGPETVSFDSLDDWSKRPETGIKFYSGKATYRKTFYLAPMKMPGQTQYYLDLGTVKNLARVRLNGRDLGVVWCAPWRVNITGAVQPDGNRLEIEVANLWPNRLIGDQALPPEQRLTWTSWNPYKKDSPLLPSGLLGPVRIMASPTP